MSNESTLPEATYAEGTANNEAANKQDKNKESGWNKVLLWFGQVIVPLLLGSFLFSGILEGYKSSLGDKKDIIDSYYRPMRVLQASCAAQHQTLATHYGELAGSYERQFKELGYMLEHPEVTAAASYEIIPKEILRANRELANATHKLNEAVRQCHVDLYIKYEELALVTGTYDKFKRLAGLRNKRLAQAEQQLQNQISKYQAVASDDDMMALMRKLVTAPSDSSESQQKLFKELDVYATPTIELNRLLMASERQRFDAEQAFFTSNRNLFAREISARQSKGFFSYLF